MNKKYQSKLEDIENEIDSLKKKKRGRPVGSKNKVEFPENWGKIKIGDKYVDFDSAWDELEVPTLRRIPKIEINEFKSGFAPKLKYPMSLTDKITWVLIAVNVAILISLVIKN